MNFQVLIDWVFVVGGVGLIVTPFSRLERERVRARWAVASIVCMGVLATAKGLACLSLDAGWYHYSEKYRYLLGNLIRLEFSGLIFGIMFVLIVSGQLRGAKRVPNVAPEN